MTYFLKVGDSRDSLGGQYLQGPRPSKQVKRDGYGFTKVIAAAWPFATPAAALHKAQIVDRHMGWGQGVIVIEAVPAPFATL